MWTPWNDLIGAVVELTCPDLWYQTILGPNTAVWVSPPGQNTLTAVAWHPSPSLCRVSMSRPSLMPAAGGDVLRAEPTELWVEQNTIILYINTFTFNTLSTFCWYTVWMYFHTVAFLLDLHEIAEYCCCWSAVVSWYCSNVTGTFPAGSVFCLSSLFRVFILRALCQQEVVCEEHEDKNSNINKYVLSSVTSRLWPQLETTTRKFDSRRSAVTMETYCSALWLAVQSSVKTLSINTTNTTKNLYNFSFSRSTWTNEDKFKHLDAYFTTGSFSLSHESNVC